MTTVAPLQVRAAPARRGAATLRGACNEGRAVQRKWAAPTATGSSSGECATCASSRRLQSRLAIGPADDPLEREADRVADRVVAAAGPPAVGRTPPQIQRSGGSPAARAARAPASVDQALAGPGSPLAPALRRDMERRFGHDFAAIRIHSGSAAERSARDLNAHAYTVGHDIVFAAGRYAPGTRDGRRLIAHELTHVVQQRGGGAHFVQRQLAGCQDLMAAPSIIGLVSGRAVHTLITRHFRATVPGARGVSIPGAYANPLRTAGICGVDESTVDPQEIGGMDPRAGAGIPDLAAINRGGVLLVGEIKPAALVCLIDGEEQLLRYIEHGNQRDATASSWRASLGVSVVSPILPSTYEAPTLRTPIPGGFAEVRTAWCTPGLLAYTVNAEVVPPPPVRVPERDPVRDPYPARSRRIRRLPDGIDWSKVVVALAALAAVLSLTPAGRLGAWLGAALGSLLRALGFAIGIGAGAVAAADPSGGKGGSGGQGGQGGSGGSGGQGAPTGQGTSTPAPAPTVERPPARPAPTVAGTKGRSNAPASPLKPAAPTRGVQVAYIEGVQPESVEVGMLPVVWLFEKGKEADKLFAVLQATSKVSDGTRTTVQFKSLLENRAGRNTFGGTTYTVTSPYRGPEPPDWVGQRTFTGDNDPTFYLDYLDTLAAELEAAGRAEGGQVRKEVLRIRRLVHDTQRAAP